MNSKNQGMKHEEVIVVNFKFSSWLQKQETVYPLKDELNPICHLQALLGAQ